jgi:hypothetical protein
MWKTLQDKTEIRINLEETWRKQTQKEVNNRKETGKRLMTFYRRQQDGSVDSVKQESQLYILQKTIRMRMEAWTLLYIVRTGDGSMDSVRRREQIICTYT